MKKAHLLLVGILASFTTMASAQVAVPEQRPEDQTTLDGFMKALRGDLNARRESAIKAVIQLTPAEAKAFHPLREAYDKELGGLAKRRMQLVQDFVAVHDKLTAEKAREIGERSDKLDTERLSLRKKYFDQMAKEVSPVVAVQFMQLERQFESMGDVQLATRMPLALK